MLKPEPWQITLSRVPLSVRSMCGSGGKNVFGRICFGRVLAWAGWKSARSCGLTKKDKYLVALDVGSTKTCAILSEVDDSGAAKFISMGAAESKGLRKGLIANLGAPATSIPPAIQQPQSVAA